MQYEKMTDIKLRAFLILLLYRKQTFDDIMNIKYSHACGGEVKCKTRSRAVARIADRTASHHLRGSRDAISHVTI